MSIHATPHLADRFCTEDPDGQLSPEATELVMAYGRIGAALAAVLGVPLPVLGRLLVTNPAYVAACHDLYVLGIRRGFEAASGAVQSPEGRA